MILIVDSGSTKTDWMYLKGEKRFDAKTGGFNPNYFPIETLYSIFKTALPEEVDPREVKTIFYYGSGCAAKENQEKVATALGMKFTEADINVASDLLGTARALCGQSEGVACILGTGSNSCFYDGAHITKNVKSLGWILADYGSGTHIGKTLITHWLLGTCPDEISKALEDEYFLTPDFVIKRIYQQNAANQYLAQFSRFVKKKIDHPFLIKLVEESFELFIHHQIVPYKVEPAVPVHFCGSVALSFQEILRKSLADYQLSMGSVLRLPMDGLIDFHHPVRK